MKNTSDPFDFEIINNEKKFSLFTKSITVVIAIVFIMIPLSDISPETFVIPKSVLFSEGCGCIVPCN